jgi:sterol desaturase/sphingolipid hydroxylase (fatty acid hydroxylase superfamily)
MYSEYFMDALYPGLLVGLVALAFLVCFERLFPKYAYVDLTGRREAKNVLVGLCYRAVVSPVLIVPLFIYFTKDYNIPFRWHRPEWWSGALGFALDFLLLDFIAYVLHILGHKIPILWRFHAVHHIDEKIDATTGIRVHFGEKVLDLALKIPPIILLGIPYQTAGLYEVISFAYIVFHHNNIRWPESVERIVSKVFVTPIYHSVHHGRRVENTDSNYTVIFSFWDALFGTRSLAARPAEGFQIGLNDHRDYSFSELMLLPFSSRRMDEWKTARRSVPVPVVSNVAE